ncbi:diguanylate cyclase domain-containing protein [Aquabacterium humicola]|uniref:diguanylate cyclase domain-containing protein n=1 Tax=Aquabacterium humicola TaxID=3237377 RepID=UPI0025429F40|nr:diguanylate cyclase [Rubrivivax pictus]
MNTADHSDDPARELATVRLAIAQAHATLAALRADVVAAERHFGSHAAAQLLEANEQLVLSALRVQTQADTAAQEAAVALREASRSAELDALTGLPNRLLLRDRLARAIASAKRHRCRAAVLFMDLNNFKQINDTLGHAVGDQVLRLAAGRLAASVREVDTVSRLGGDEFVILLGDVGHAGDAQGIAEKIGAALGAPGRIGDHVIRLSASIGISLYPDDGDEADTLIARADDAMYAAKRRGLRSFVFRHVEEAVQGTGPSPATLRALQRPLTAYEQAHADHEQQRALLQEANEHLVMAALTAQQLQAAAEQAQVRQTEILAVVAHELRSPLAPIRAAAALLNQGRADAPLLQYVQAVIERQVVHMTRLVGDLLDVSRSSTGKLRLQRQPVDLSELIDAAVQACRPAMDARLQHFLAFVPEGAMVVDGDPVRLTQVLCNLLDNASKYTQVGGEIGLSATAADDTLAIAVSDNGIGITAEALQKVFEPFAQDRHAIGFNGSGLGIGLTVVRELVEAHGGSVVASSAGIGFGSRFVVTLPLYAPPARP